METLASTQLLPDKLLRRNKRCDMFFQSGQQDLFTGWEAQLQDDSL